MKFQHPHPKRLQYAPYKHNLPQYGAKQQIVELEQELPELSAEGKRLVQQVVGTLLFYSRQLNPTMLTALSSISAEQNNGTASTAQAVAMLLDYVATNPDAKIRFRRSDMTLRIHSDASYLSEKRPEAGWQDIFILGKRKWTRSMNRCWSLPKS
eukprot:817293-Ditylum_brightwellii.AAC.1